MFYKCVSEMTAIHSSESNQYYCISYVPHTVKTQLQSVLNAAPCKMWPFPQQYRNSWGCYHTAGILCFYPLIFVTTALWRVNNEVLYHVIYTAAYSIHAWCHQIPLILPQVDADRRISALTQADSGFCSSRPTTDKLGAITQQWQCGPSGGWLGLSLTVRRTKGGDESRAALYNSDTNQTPKIILKKVEMCVGLIMSVLLLALFLAAAQVWWRSKKIQNSIGWQKWNWWDM